MVDSRQRDWHLLEFRVLEQDRDEVVDLLWSLETIGLQEERLSREILVRAYFWPSRNLELLRADFENAARRRDIGYSHFKAVGFRSDPTEWVEEFKKTFKGFEVTPRIFVHPSWEGPSEGHPLNILIEPGRAFGSGTHETTQLCLAALEEVLTDHRSAIDVGTGSGILAIALRKMRPELNLTAIDNDPTAIDVAWKNFQANETTDIGLFVAEPGALQGKYELMVANLTLEVFRQRAQELKNLSSRLMLLSGFTEEQAGAVRDLFEADASSHLRERWERNGWTCLAIEKAT